MTTTPTKTRVYLVKIQGHPSRLVRATLAHIAERHVIGQLVNASVASKDELIDLLQAGARVEDAADPQPGLDLGRPRGNGQDEPHLGGTHGVS
jgi:hypothetical protein